MRKFPRGVQVYIYSIMALGLGMLVYFFWGFISHLMSKQPLPFNYLIVLGFCIFTPVVIIAELRPEEFLGRIATIVSFSVIYSGILFIGKEAAVIIAMIRNVTAGIINKMRWYSIFFNISHSILAVGTAGILFNLINQGKPLFGINDARLSYFIAASVYLLINVALVYGYIRFVQDYTDEQLTFYLQWRDIKIQSVVFAIFLLVILYKQSPLLLILMLLPSVIIFYIVRNYRKLQTETMKTLEALATGIENRYGYNYQHTSGVVDYAVKLARKLKLHRAEIEIIESAARIHDLGKVSIPDEILQKNGPLTKEEFEVMKQHAAMGSEIASKLSAYKSGIGIIRHHHEWYDGNGYPDGLKNEDIPLGARILTIADCYDAMTNDRPYRKALGLEEVVRELKKGKGTHFDPKLVDLFIEILKDEYVQKQKQAEKRAARESRRAAGARDEGGNKESPSPASALHSEEVP